MKRSNHSKKIEKIAVYTDVYNDQIRKEAVTGIEVAAIVLTIYGISAMVSGFANSIASSTAEVFTVKAKLQDMNNLIDAQATDGFGQFASVFSDFKTNSLTVIKLIDEMIKPPSSTSDTAQIKKAQEFIQAANAVLVGSSAVSGALDQLQTMGSQVGNFIHGIGLNFGFDLTRWHEFNRLTGQIAGALSLLVSKVEGQLKAAVAAGQQTDAQAKAQGAATQPAQGQTPVSGAEGMSRVKL